LEGFWGYLKRKLSAKGGIRRERLPIYLGEYVWRYNHKNLSLKEQENLLFKLIIIFLGSKIELYPLKSDSVQLGA
jgi:transposase-like protein